MPELSANGIRIEYDTFGDRGADPLLLIMGLGGQMTLWHEDFCRGLSSGGHFVVRYDNRDVGLSTKFDEAGTPNVLEMMQRPPSGEAPQAGYTLHDMADDAAGVLDALEIEAAHVIGASMGGMIAQTVANRHPARVRTLVSIMSSTGNPELPPAKPEAMAVLMRERAGSRDEAIEAAVEGGRVLAGHDTAEAILGAEMLVIEGMGHDLPVQVFPRLIAAIHEHAKKAAASA